MSRPACTRSPDGHLPFQTDDDVNAQFVAGVTDFGPGRSEIFANSADAYLRVHHRGLFDADVTEGSNGIRERLAYDWSDPRS